MRLGRERPRKGRKTRGPGHRREASMRLGRERPRKAEIAANVRGHEAGFNEAGARTPQKVVGYRPGCVVRRAASMRLGRERPRKAGVLALRDCQRRASMRLGRERPRKTSTTSSLWRWAAGFNEAGARTPQKAWIEWVNFVSVIRASMRLGRERPRKHPRDGDECDTTGQLQ